MLPDRVSNPGPLTYESGALPPGCRLLKPLIKVWVSLGNVGPMTNSLFLNLDNHNHWRNVKMVLKLTNSI